LKLTFNWSPINPRDPRNRIESRLAKLRSNAIEYRFGNVILCKSFKDKLFVSNFVYVCVCVLLTSRILFLFCSLVNWKDSLTDVLFAWHFLMCRENRFHCLGIQQLDVFRCWTKDLKCSIDSQSLLTCTWYRKRVNYGPTIWDERKKIFSIYNFVILKTRRRTRKVWLAIVDLSLLARAAN